MVTNKVQTGMVRGSGVFEASKLKMSNSEAKILAKHPCAGDS